jgi:hypothetical protein
MQDFTSEKRAREQDAAARLDDDDVPVSSLSLSLAFYADWDESEATRKNGLGGSKDMQTCWHNTHIKVNRVVV